VTQIKKNLLWSDVHTQAAAVSAIMAEQYHPNNLSGAEEDIGVIRAYAIPNGGIPVVLLVQQYVNQLPNVRLEIVEDPKDCNCYIDDLIDSGDTMQGVFEAYGEKDFWSLYDKRQMPDPKPWLSFPWERMAKNDGPHDNIKRILQYIGEDPERPGLIETPHRVVAAMSETFGGYKKDPESVFKVFDEGVDELVILQDIEFYSTCEHHMLPFIGSATIGYIPRDGKVIGVSKLARLLDIFAHRLQIQERLTTDITTAINKHLNPIGSACIIKAKHLCMMCRGVQKQGSVMKTSSLTGVFRKDAKARSELFQLIGG